MKDTRLVYAETVCKILQDSYDLECHTEMIFKNNTSIPAIIISSKSNALREVLYMDGYERAQVAHKDAAFMVWNELRNIEPETSDMAYLVSKTESFEEIQDCIFWQLFSATNKDDIIRAGYLYKESLNLLIVPFIRLIEGDTGVHICIKKQHLGIWNKTGADIFATAAKNIDRDTYIEDIKSFTDEIEAEYEMDEEDEEDVLNEKECEPLFAISFSEKRGAGAMFNVNALERFCSKRGGSTYILLTSANEAILIPTNAFDPVRAKELTDELRGINDSNPPEDKLSDFIYFFDGKKIRCVK